MKFLKYVFLSIVCLLAFTENAEAREFKRGIVISTSAVKSSNSNSSKTLVNDTGGTISLSSPEAVEVLEESGDYYKIRFLYSGFFYDGYFPKNKMNVSSYTTSNEYEDYLRNVGFPNYYVEKLAVLKAIHPNWNFIPSFTGGETVGMDFQYAVSGETEVVGNNAINSANTSLRSTEDGAYQNGVWIYVAGNGWYAASKQTVAFYMDPRNFLDESHIFMFENLGYNPSTQTIEVINKIIGSTFMKGSFNCYEGANGCLVGAYTFADTFLRVGSDKKVSPVHLASRVVQEQGSSGSVLSLGNGYNGEYIGYYNFFNIGAVGSTDPEVIVNGLKYAKNRNWNNQYIAIHAGSDLLAQNYIARGQATRYYQKFNTITKSYFANQYMQNVRAPYTEAYSSYTGYYNSFSSIDEWNNSTYEFLIPIYSNLPDSTSLDTSQNSDATLRNLHISNCTLNPIFQSNADLYDCYISKDIKEINVEAEATNQMAQIKGTGKYTLSEGDSVVDVIVTASNGNTKTYKINIHPIETDGYTPLEILNGIGIKANDLYASNIALRSDVSNIISSIKNKYHFARVKITNAQGIEIENGIVKTGDVIELENAGTTKIYKIVIYGDANGDGNVDIVDLLKIRQHLVSFITLENEYMAAADLTKDGKIDIIDLLNMRKYLLNQYEIVQG